MTKRGRLTLPARKDERDDDSLLVRSAESLGRVIGSLQRQVRGASKRVTALAADAVDRFPEMPAIDSAFLGDAAPSTARAIKRSRRASRKSASGRKKTARKKTGARKSASRKRTASRASSKKR